jgi:hypothetical protein
MLNSVTSIPTRSVRWQPTGARVFIFAARVDGGWWVLRLNGFPDHPMFTLFVNGRVVGDVDDFAVWDAGHPALTVEQRDEVLTMMRGLGPYGSEIGAPCDGDWCCAHRTDAFILGSASDPTT